LCQLSAPQSVFIEEEHLTIPPETKVCATTFYQDLTHENTTWRPYMEPIATSTIDISSHVTFDTVWYASICHGEKPAIDQTRLTVVLHDIKSISEEIISIRNTRNA
jgi:hypothetical protein